MGERNLRANGSALIALALALTPLQGQGPVYRERWGYLHLENRRLELLSELAQGGQAVRERAAQLLAEPDGGQPFVPVAKALAHARGVAADGAFVLRSMVSVFVLPEVADPEGRNETCRATNVSLYLPFAVPLPKELAFDVDVRDGSGERVFSQRLVEGLGQEDLRMARPVVKVPCPDLADGTYELHVRTIVDGGDPGPKDPVLRWPFHVLRGYQARCEAALAQTVTAAPALPELPRALLEGMAQQVARAFAGEAFDDTSVAIDELERLELALRNVAAGAHVLTGMAGDVATALPTGNPRGLPCVLRLPSGFEPVGERAPRTLVVFAAASPAYDLSMRRPTAPGSRGPAWLARELPAFGKRADCDVAFVGSPGEGRNYAEHLERAIAALTVVFRGHGRPVVLVCDRESAAVVSLRAADLPVQVGGVVLVGSGALTGPILDRLDSRAVRLLPLHGHPGAEGMQRALDYVALRRRDGVWRGDVERLSDVSPPWLFGVPLLAEQIGDFVSRVAGR